MLATTSDLIFFLGRFHPLFLHLPIGLLCGWLVVELISVFRKKNSSYQSIVLGVLSTLSAWSAVATGYMLSIREIGYGEELLSDHFWMGLVFAIIVTLAAIAMILTKRLAENRWAAYATRGLLLLSFIMMVPAAHHGGSLSHGPNWLTEHAPEQLPDMIVNLLGHEPEAVVIDTTQEKTTYNSLVQPILISYCGACHANGQRKGGFSFDSFEALQTSLIPNISVDSRLIQVMKLPAGHEDRMPPIEAPQATLLEIDAIAWWVDAGAQPDTPLDLASIPAQFHPLLTAAPELAKRKNSH